VSGAAPTASQKRVPRILLLREVAAALRISPSTVRRLIREGKLPRLADRPVRILERDVHAYITAQLVARAGVPGMPLASDPLFAAPVVASAPTQASKKSAAAMEKDARAWAARLRMRRVIRRG